MSDVKVTATFDSPDVSKQALALLDELHDEACEQDWDESTLEKQTDGKIKLYAEDETAYDTQGGYEEVLEQVAEKFGVTFRLDYVDFDDGITTTHFVGPQAERMDAADTLQHILHPLSFLDGLSPALVSSAGQDLHLSEAIIEKIIQLRDAYQAHQQTLAAQRTEHGQA